MDTGTIITALILLMACILPFILMNIKRKNKENMLQNQLQTLAARMDAGISQYDIWGNAAIGIDNDKQKLFFFKIAKAKVQNHSLDLAEIKHCHIIKTGQPAVENISLAFDFVAPNKPAASIELYNAVHDGFVLKGEMELAEKWKLILNKKMVMLQPSS